MADLEIKVAIWWVLRILREVIRGRLTRADNAFGLLPAFVEALN